ncbi:MAG: prepilin-type N-terminal cleavage/methylation domain-containing protein [Gemmataceae bacterium]|nr:prepilin-type N-terminal cleavage/methylation domain-containing protein [Gemmataceae bacterium]
MKPDRRGFTILECSIALMVLLLAASIVAEMAGWSVRERMRSEVRLAATEWAAGVLEDARQQHPPTTEWARRQKLPADIAERYGTPSAIVTVAPEEGSDGFLRVAVKVTWQLADGKPEAPLELMTLVRGVLRP